MQRSRNILWLFISYGLVTGLVFDPTRVLLGTAEETHLTVTRLELYLIAGLIVAGFLIRARILQATSTLTHELGHAVAVGMTGGSVHSLRTRLDTSGITGWSSRPTRVTSGFVAALGPLANALLFAGSARALTNGFSPTVLAGLAAILILVALTSVRNFWGWLTTLATASALGLLYLALSQPKLWNQSPLAFASPRTALLSILCVTAFNSGVSVRYSLACRKADRPGMDEYKFAKALGLPAVAGGYFILIANVGICFAALNFLAENALSVH